MSKSVKGTQTEKNLLTSFAGESQARMRYTYFASVARGRKINCVMRRFFPSSSVGDRPAPRGCTSTPDERKVTTI